MQYGNENTNVAGKYITKFKSYYVVWKLFYTSKLSSSQIMFKSYYVVWKRVGFYTLAGYAISLNRTMQYGNQKFPQQRKSPDKFKSYYVVWKLWKLNLNNKQDAV